MARHTPRPDSPGIVSAQLQGAARRLLREKANRAACLAELHAITTDPRLLGLASGTALGAWRATQSYDSDRVTRMLDAAGADQVVRDEQAAVVVRRLTSDRGRNGIGNPS